MSIDNNKNFPVFVPDQATNTNGPRTEADTRQECYLSAGWKPWPDNACDLMNTSSTPTCETSGTSNNMNVDNNNMDCDHNMDCEASDTSNNMNVDATNDENVTRYFRVFVIDSSELFSELFENVESTSNATEIAQRPIKIPKSRKRAQDEH